MPSGVALTCSGFCDLAAPGAIRYSTAPTRSAVHCPERRTGRNCENGSRRVQKVRSGKRWRSIRSRCEDVGQGHCLQCLRCDPTKRSRINAAWEGQPTGEITRCRYGEDRYWGDTHTPWAGRWRNGVGSRRVDPTRIRSASAGATESAQIGTVDPAIKTAKGLTVCVARSLDERIARLRNPQKWMSSGWYRLWSRSLILFESL
jgi:hypothetical protein